MRKLDPASYLAALIDGEGSVAHGPTVRCVEIANTEYELLVAAVECCDALGIRANLSREYAPHRNSKKPYKKLRITGRDNLRRLLAVVPLQSGRKHAQLAAMATSFKNSGYVRRADLPVAQLRQMRHAGKSQREIGQFFGVHQATAARWLRLAGVT